MIFLQALKITLYFLQGNRYNFQPFVLSWHFMTKQRLENYIDFRKNMLTFIIRLIWQLKIILSNCFWFHRGSCHVNSDLGGFWKKNMGLACCANEPFSRSSSGWMATQHSNFRFQIFVDSSFHSQAWIHQFFEQELFSKRNLPQRLENSFFLKRQDEWIV